jgi:hypothetical protein
MCATPFWGIAGAIACSYFAYLAYVHVRDGEIGWYHDWQTILTSTVWMALIVGLLSETNCWRERTFFVLLLTNFGIVFGLAFWKLAPMSEMRTAREISLALWLLSVLASLSTLRGNTGRAGSNPSEKEGS